MSHNNYTLLNKFDNGAIMKLMNTAINMLKILEISSGTYTCDDF